MKIIFNDELSDNMQTLCAFIDEYSKEFGGVLIDEPKLNWILRTINNKVDFPHCDGFDKASLFKKYAYFIVTFVQYSPLEFPRAGDKFKIFNKISNKEKAHNAFFALLLSFHSLHNSKILTDEKELSLSNPVELSKHSLCDLVDAVSETKAIDGYKMLTIILEQLAYKANPECQYSPLITFNN